MKYIYFERTSPIQTIHRNLFHQNAASLINYYSTNSGFDMGTYCASLLNRLGINKCSVQMSQRTFSKTKEKDIWQSSIISLSDKLTFSCVSSFCECLYIIYSDILHLIRLRILPQYEGLLRILIFSSISKQLYVFRLECFRTIMIISTF